jgi:hypothetical protein
MSRPSSTIHAVTFLPVMPCIHTSVTLMSFPGVLTLNMCHCSSKIGSLIFSARAISRCAVTASFAASPARATLGSGMTLRFQCRGFSFCF